jgi:hypothetical protein
LARLRGHGEPQELPVIIERNSGFIVDRLLEAGHPVVPVHPTSFTPPDPGGEPPEPSPTRVTATSWLITCAPTLTGYAGWSPPKLGCVNCRRWCGYAMTRSTPELDAYWPGPRNLFRSVASPIALGFLTDYPAPHAAAHLGQARMAGFCRRHCYRGDETAAGLLAWLRAAPVVLMGLSAATLAAVITAQVHP